MLYQVFGGEDSLMDSPAVQLILEEGAASAAEKLRAVAEWAAKQRDAGDFIQISCLN
jgi:hypothetical protein